MLDWSCQGCGVRSQVVAATRIVMGKAGGISTLAALHHETRMNRLGNYHTFDSLALAISKELRKSNRASAW